MANIAAIPALASCALRMCVGAALLFCHEPALARLVVMHGYADVTSALVWIQAEAPGPIRVSWRPESEGRERTITLDAKASDELAAVARLYGLAPGSSARYRIEGDGDVREGSVRTQPVWRDAKPAPEITMYGREQLEWLKNLLLNLRNPVKLFVSGSQVWNDASRFDGLHQFPSERAALAGFLLSQRIDGLLFVSGDRHFTELLRVDRTALSSDAYPLYEFTSSPLTSRPWDDPESRERNNPQLVPGTLVGMRQFAIIRIRGPGNDRSIALESHDQTGALLWRHAL